MGFPPSKQRETESADSSTDGVWVSVVTVELHSVRGLNTGGLVSVDTPVTVLFNLRLDVADEGSEVLHTKLA